MTFTDAIRIITAPTDLTAWSVHDYVTALELVLESKRITKVTRAYATGVLQGMLLVIGEVEAGQDDEG